MTRIVDFIISAPQVICHRRLSLTPNEHYVCSILTPLGPRWLVNIDHRDFKAADCVSIRVYGDQIAVVLNDEFTRTKKLLIDPEMSVKYNERKLAALDTGMKFECRDPNYKSKAYRLKRQIGSVFAMQATFAETNTTCSGTTSALLKTHSNQTATAIYYKI